jgi:hypothetical protein
MKTNHFLLLVPLFLLSLFVSSGKALAENNIDKYTYQIVFSPSDSKPDYTVNQSELLYNQSDGLNANIKIAGKLVLSSTKAASNCQVRLIQSSIIARNVNGQERTIRLRGSIGDKPLSTQFTTPTFNQFNEASFFVEGFIDPGSYKQGLLSGPYNYNFDQTSFEVLFGNTP